MRGAVSPEGQVLSGSRPWMLAWADTKRCLGWRVGVGVRVAVRVRVVGRVAVGVGVGMAVRAAEPPRS